MRNFLFYSYNVPSFTFKYCICVSFISHLNLLIKQYPYIIYTFLNAYYVSGTLLDTRADSQNKEIGLPLR